MKNLRTWGKPPYKIAVVHGGPGMPGYLAPVARELSKVIGVLEPLQTKNSFEGQIEELHNILREYAHLPVILIGHSWGAFLSFVVTAQYPGMIKKLILIGGGPFEEKYADNIDADRLNRLTEDERIEAFKLIEIIDAAKSPDRDKAMARLGELWVKADTYAPLPEQELESMPVSEEINRKVWAEAKKLRTSGEILEIGKRITCPVIAIHGDYDPHLVAGVQEPLSRVLKNFRFILLEKCGHYPWLEKYARNKFYEILRKEITPWH
ncbi:MAG: alpha/beta hydrolase [Dehalococcoidales bacterium]